MTSAGDRANKEDDRRNGGLYPAAKMVSAGPAVALLGLLGLLLVGAVYGDSLRLPFFFDDFVHLPYVESTALGRMFLSAEGLAYYRPLPFAVWRLLYLALGENSPLLHHGLNLALHLANGMLVGWLAAALWRDWRWPRALLAAALFWLYPFSYQAVPWAGAGPHLFVTILVLSAIASYLLWRQTHRRRWLLFSLAATALAPFSHENGVMVGPAVFLVALTGAAGAVPRTRRRLAQAVRHGALWSLPALFWLPLWWSAPKGVEADVGINNLESILQNTVYWLQGMGYPLTFLGGWFVRLGMNDMIAALLLALPALALAAFVQRLPALRGSNRPPEPDGRLARAAFPWLWALLAWTPALVMLGFDYVVSSPRLLMLASAGIAWLWADVTVRLLRGQPAGWRVTLVSLAVGLLLLQNVVFIRTRMTGHLLLGSAVDQAVALTVSANAQGRQAVFLNFPTWTAPGTVTYALGHEGVVLWPAYIPQEYIVSVQTGESASFRIAEYTDIRVQTPYYLGTDGGGPVWSELAPARAQLFVVVPNGERVDVQAAGLFDPPPLRTEPLARFANGVNLLAAESQVAETTTVTLTWQVESGVTEPATVFVHLLDEAGQLVAQDDGYPLAGTYPFLLWAVGQVTADVRLLDRPGAAMLVGLYNPATGERLPAADATGALLPDGALRLPLR